MKVSIHLKEDRIKHIKEAFSEAKVSDMDKDGFFKMEFDLNSDFDVIRLFHAGIQCGQEAMKEYYDQYKL